MVEKFNPTGINGRDCPICYRIGALKGESTLECLGCATRFTVAPLGTLTRLPTPPVRALTHDDLERVRGGA